jgi:hypothetical protein
MSHKCTVGQDVYYQPPIKHTAARGIYKITARLPIEADGRVSYRIKSAAEAFERIADESQFTGIS